MTRVTLENQDGLYIIESQDDRMTVEDMYETFFNPIMMAATYHPDSITDYFMAKANEVCHCDDIEEFDKECECEECSCNA